MEEDRKIKSSHPLEEEVAHVEANFGNMEDDLEIELSYSSEYFEVDFECKEEDSMEEDLKIGSSHPLEDAFAYLSPPSAVMIGEEMHKSGGSRLERKDFSMNVGLGRVNRGSRLIYFTFPADSTFREEDVSNYFSNYGPVQDVRFPYQQIGFVTFVNPETVKLILAAGKPHFLCGARVLVKLYRGTGMIPNKNRKQQQMEREEFSAYCSPIGLGSRDPFELQIVDEQPWRLTATYPHADRVLTATYPHADRVMAKVSDEWSKVSDEWRTVGLKFSAEDKEFLERSQKKFGREDWQWIQESSEAPNALKSAAAGEKQKISAISTWVPRRHRSSKRSEEKLITPIWERKPAAAVAVALEKETLEEQRLKAMELRRRALVLKRRLDLLHLVLSYPMKTEESKWRQPCLGSSFSEINQNIKWLEYLMFDESSLSATALGEGDDICRIYRKLFAESSATADSTINHIRTLFHRVEENLGKFDFEIAPYLEKQPPKAKAAADVQVGLGSTSTKHHVADNSIMPATIENTPPPVMQKMAIDFAVRQILDFFELRKSGKIGISGKGCEQALEALKDVPNITSMFDFVQNVSLDQHQSISELHVNVLRQLYTKSNEDYSARFLLLADSIDQETDLDDLNNLDVCIVFRTRPQRANEPLEVDLEIRMEDHLLPWNLFCKEAGRVLLSTTTLQQKVEHFIKESRGHLLAIILLTKALQNETDPSVQNLLLSIQQPEGTTIHDQVDAMMMNVLRFIWARLDTTTKNCIKYFIAHKKEEQKEITKDSLIGLWISSGWIETFEDGLLVLKKLINYFFLEEDTETGHFRMRKETMLGLLNIFAPSPPEAEKWNAKEIRLIDNKISELPENPNCSILVKLYLQCNHDLMVIPSSFFNCMPVLHVLDLSFTSIKSLPESISKLVTLRQLFLRGCDLLTKLPPEIGALKRLEEFDLEGTHLMYLPKEIGELVYLTNFKVCLSGRANLCKEHNGVDTIIPRKALSNLHQLKELSIDVLPDGDWWDVEVRAVINEVGSLSHLEELKLYLPVAKALKDVISYVNGALKKFRLIVGPREQCFISRLPHEVEEEFNNSEKFTKVLKYINGEGKPTEEITKVLKHVNAFSLERHWTVKNLSEFGHGNVEKLQFCYLVECNEIETIIDIKDDKDDSKIQTITDSENDDKDLYIVDDNEDDSHCDYENVLGNLKYFSVHYMKSMQSLCKVPAAKVGLMIMPHLESLALHTCPSLNTIFTPAMLRSLVNLKELIVEDCPNINSLVVILEGFASDSDDSLQNLKKINLPKLEKISLLNLPELDNISGGLHIAPKLKSMIIFYCPKLEMLSSAEVSSKELKVIKGDTEWWNALKWYKSDLTFDQRDYLASIFVQLDLDAWGFN